VGGVGGGGVGGDGGGEGGTGVGVTSPEVQLAPPPHGPFAGEVHDFLR
jgi:hypothetical protein